MTPVAGDPGSGHKCVPATHLAARQPARGLRRRRAQEPADALPTRDLCAGWRLSVPADCPLFLRIHVFTPPPN